MNIDLKISSAKHCTCCFGMNMLSRKVRNHDDVIKWNFSAALLAFCAGNSPIIDDSPHKGQWRGALMFSLICAWTNSLANNGDACDLRRHCAYHDVTVMLRNYLVGLLWPTHMSYWNQMLVYFFSIKTLRPRWEFSWIKDVSLKFVARVPINNIPVLVQIVDWSWRGGKPLSEPMLVSLLTHICHTASMSSTENPY